MTGETPDADDRIDAQPQQRPNETGRDPDAPTVDRRRFLAYAGAAGAALTLPGTAAADERTPRLELIGHSTLGSPDGGHTDMDVREDLGLAAVGSFVYGGAEARVVDVSDPATPEQTGTVRASGDGFAYVNDVFWHPEEPWVFTANESDGGVGIVDASDPANPELVHEHVFEDHDHSHAHGVVALDEQYVIASGTDAGISILDVSDPENTEEVETFQAGDGFVHDTQVRGDYAYLAHWDRGLYILDVSDPEDVEVAAAFDYQEEEADVPLRNAHHTFPHPEKDICLVGEEVGSGDPGYKHVVSFDLETGATELLSSFRPPQGSAQQPQGQQAFRWTGHFSDWGVGDQQDVLFSGDYKAGVQTFDLSDPADPERLDNYMTTEGVGELRSEAPERAIDDVPLVWGANTKDSEYVYVSDYNTGVYVFTFEGY